MMYRSVPMARMLPLGLALAVEKVLRRLTGIRELPIISLGLQEIYSRTEVDAWSISSLIIPVEQCIIDQSTVIARERRLRLESLDIEAGSKLSRYQSYLINLGSNTGDQRGRRRINHTAHHLAPLT